MWTWNSTPIEWSSLITLSHVYTVWCKVKFYILLMSVDWLSIFKTFFRFTKKLSKIRRPIVICLLSRIITRTCTHLVCACMHVRITFWSLCRLHECVCFQSHAEDSLLICIIVIQKIIAAATAQRCSHTIFTGPIDPFVCHFRESNWVFFLLWFWYVLWWWSP